MKILVLGSGGREHALVWKLSQNSDVSKIYCIPGNGGIESIARCSPLSPGDFRALTSFVRENHIDFTVVGPEQPLVEGIVDYFESEKLPIFGPNQSAARMEGSKVFAKTLMASYNIPTALFQTFEDPAAALRYIDRLKEQPMVIKADGLAAGKGSIICINREAARKAIDSLMNRKIFKEAGSKIVIEEMMSGEEVSIFVLTDGNDYITLTPAQDFKRALNKDQGKNTGGMGSYAPTPFLTEALYRQAATTIIEPTLSALQSQGIHYKGVLYCGLMLTPEGPKTVEFNCRFGDPETQVVLPLLESDLLEIMRAVHSGTLGKLRVRLKSQSAVCVVLASGGYPDSYEKDKEITGLDDVPPQTLVFHAGTRRENGLFYTSGGRVLGITAIAPKLSDAANRAYAAVAAVNFEKMHYRSDIAERARKLLERR